MFQRHSRVGVTSQLRSRSHDYGEPAAYLITTCTEQRLCLFGTVYNNAFQPNTAGQAIMEMWRVIEDRFPSVIPDSMVLMPNHLHGILLIEQDMTGASLDDVPNPSRVMQWFKSVTTVEYARGVRNLGWQPFPKRLWQQGFHDHIIRSERDLEPIRAYIEANPSNWRQDDLHAEMDITPRR